MNTICGANPAAGIVAVDRAAADLRRGGLVVIEGESGAALALAAETATADSLAALSRIGNGQTRLALTARRASALNLPVNGSGVVTLPLAGIMDTCTVRRLADPTWAAGSPLPDSLAVEEVGEQSFPSAAVRLSKLAQLLPAAITAPLAEGGPSGALRVGIEAIRDYPRLATETLRPIAEAKIPLEAAENARLVGFRPANGGLEHFAIVIGNPAAHQPTLCRLHSECFTGDLLGSLRCDCGPQLRNAIRMIGLVGHGVVLYLAHEGRGIGLINKLRAYQLQDQGIDTLEANQHLGFEPDERCFQVAGVMLRQLGISRVRLLTNNPAKVLSLAEEGVEVVERVPHAVPPNPHNRSYLATKARRAGHWLEAV